MNENLQDPDKSWLATDTSLLGTDKTWRLT
jgi:hypothetical protein